MRNEGLMKNIADCYKQVSEEGGKKAQYESESVKITVYRVGTIIRIDIKEK